jgi:hypothetical protein
MMPTAATPVITPATGVYVGSQTVTITTATGTATIYYTLDSSTPTTSSTVYTGSIGVTTSTTVKAIAVAPGYIASGIATSNIVIASTGYVNPIGINMGSSVLAYDNFPLFKNQARSAFLGLSSGGIPSVNAQGWPTNTSFLIRLWAGSNVPSWATAASATVPFTCGFQGTGSETISAYQCTVSALTYNSMTGYSTFTLYGITPTVSGFGFYINNASTAGTPNIFAYLPAYPGTACDVVGPSCFTNEAIAHYSQYAVLKSEVWCNVWQNSTMGAGSTAPHPNIRTPDNFKMLVNPDNVVVTLASEYALNATTATLASPWTDLSGTYGLYPVSPGVNGIQVGAVTTGSTTITFAQPATVAAGSTTLNYCTELYPYQWLLQFCLACNNSIYWNLPILEDGLGNPSGYVPYASGSYTLDIVNQYTTLKSANHSYTGKLYLAVGNELWNIGQTLAPSLAFQQLPTLSGIGASANSTNQAYYMAYRYFHMYALIMNSSAASNFSLGNIQVVAEQQQGSSGLTYQQDMLNYLTGTLGVAVTSVKNYVQWMSQAPYLGVTFPCGNLNYSSSSHNTVQLTLTGVPAAGATNAHLTAVWLPSGWTSYLGSFTTTFGNGDVRALTMSSPNGGDPTYVTWTVALSATAGLTTNITVALPSAKFMPLALTTPPAMGAMSANLDIPWSPAGDFGDPGPWQVTFTNGATPPVTETHTVTFSGATAADRTLITWTDSGLQAGNTVNLSIALPTEAQVIQCLTNQAAIQVYESRLESWAVLAFHYSMGTQTYESGADLNGLSQGSLYTPNTVVGVAITDTTITPSMQVPITLYYQLILDAGVGVVNHFHSSIGNDTLQATTDRWAEPGDYLAITFGSGTDPITYQNSPVIAALQSFQSGRIPQRNYIAARGDTVSGANYVDNYNGVLPQVVIGNGYPPYGGTCWPYIVNFKTAGTYQVVLNTTGTTTGTTRLEYGSQATGFTVVNASLAIASGTNISNILGNITVAAGCYYILLGDTGTSSITWNYLQFN